MLRIAALRSFSNPEVVMARASFAAKRKTQAPASSLRLRSRQLGMMHVVPNFLFGEVQEPGQHDEEDHDLEAEPLARVQRRLRRPHQEGCDVAAILIDRRR